MKSLDDKVAIALGLRLEDVQRLYIKRKDDSCADILFLKMEDARRVYFCSEVESRRAKVALARWISLSPTTNELDKVWVRAKRDIKDELLTLFIETWVFLSKEPAELKLLISHVYPSCDRDLLLKIVDKTKKLLAKVKKR